MTGFDHEKLDVYRAAIEFVAASASILEELPRGSSHLTDQLHRAATSIPLNIAEGAGEFSRRDKARFYRMALRSAAECAALLDVLRRLQAVSEEHFVSGRDSLGRIVAMLTRMAKSQTERPGPGWGSGS